jgi:hypothetical protein
MKLTRCNQGHFYDADKYTTCPHCQNGQEDDGSKTMPSTPSQTAKIDQGETEPITNLKKEVDDVQKTVGIFKSQKGNTQPVAGWLVCVDGPHFGEDFKIKMGRNFVGRMNTMDIVLSKDSSVSREKHLIIVYEPKGNMFIVQAGDSKELSYLNEKVILSPQELNPYDTLKIGASTLLFVPFCSENFNWNDVKADEEK